MCPSLAESIGVNKDSLLISQPDSAENLLSVVDTLTKSGSVSVIVVDSVRIGKLSYFYSILCSVPLFSYLHVQSL